MNSNKSKLMKLFVPPIAAGLIGAVSISGVGTQNLPASYGKGQSVNHLEKRRAILLLLSNSFVVEDDATDVLSQPGRGEDHFAISATGFLGQGNA